MARFRALVVAAVWLTALPAWGASPEGREPTANSAGRARELFVQGKKHYAERDFEAAIAAFQAAGKLHPSPLLEYNTGRCFDELGRRAEAIARYEAYLRGRPDAPNAAEVKRRVGVLKRQLEQPKKNPRSEGPLGPGDPYADLERQGGYPTRGGGAATATGHAGAVPATRPVVPAAGSVVPAGGLAASGQTNGDQGANAPQKAITNQTSPTAPGGPRADEAQPVYKQWWFWVAVVGGAAIAGFIIAMAVSGGANGDEQNSAAQQGAVLLEF